MDRLGFGRGRRGLEIAERDLARPRLVCLDAKHRPSDRDGLTTVKPSFAKIWQCATYGSIDLAGANANSSTTHIVYALTSGNGQTGFNTVTATAIDGYTLKPGATSSSASQNSRASPLAAAAPRFRAWACPRRSEASTRFSPGRRPR